MNVELRVDDLIPRPREVLAAQGVPPGVTLSPRLEALAADALALLAASAEPRGVVEPISREEFGVLLAEAEGNAHDPVVGWIHPRAEGLGLFAGTLGRRVSDEIEGLLAGGEYPLAVSLDAAASRMTDHTSRALATAWRERLLRSGEADGDTRVLGYSPGYCGWHVSGQRPLFARLRPERIGITLNDACLMHPLKSVSGVLVGGPASVHRFETGFTFCDACRDRSCVARMRSFDDDRTSNGSTPP
ncbi:MAG: hypothetical protein OEZ65_15665 [Gemmatimonadota bacterium]|nr:hypothetical protein [Gemmatimonadota bacterium]